MPRLCLMFVVVLTGCFLPGSYGPERDQSKFVTAQLAPSGRVVFSYHHFKYRPAQGMAAFPDGGIPKYTADRNLIGVYDTATKDVRVLLEEKNTRWSNGQGEYYVTLANGPLVYVNRGGQTRDLKGSLNEYFLLDIETRATSNVRYREALAAQGQESRGMYLVTPQGHIVFVTAALSTPRNTEEGQVWLRMPDDSYRLVANTRHYEGFENGEIIYWVLATREFNAYDITTHVHRPLPGYKVRGYVDVTEGVLVQGDTVALGVKRNGRWTYTPLPIDPKSLKR